MKLRVVRDKFNAKQTLGRLYIDDQLECYTLEDVVREVPGQLVASWKISGQTAIPCGVYRVILSLSVHFGRILPLLLDVLGFEGVRLHPGNTEADSEGCILLGDIRFVTYIGASRIAAARVQAKIQAALDHGESVTVSIEGLPAR